MNRILLAVVLSAFFFIIPALHAQDAPVSFSLMAGSLSPMGSFGDQIGADARITRRFGFDYGDKVGMAVTGVAIGAEMYHHLWRDNLSWVISTKLLWNPVDETAIDDYFRDELGDTIQISFTNGSWLNIPLFTGFQVSYRLNQMMRLSAGLQGGINLSRQAERVVRVSEIQVEKTTFKLTPEYGYEIGGAITFFNRYILGVRYFNMASPRFEGTRKLNEKFFTSIPKREMNVDGDERPIAMMMVYLGLEL